MLNEEKIRIMTGIAMFEKKAGRDILPASRYFKSDYVGGRMIRSFIFYTFSSMLCLALWVLYQMEDIMSTMDVTALLASAKHVALFYAAGLSDRRAFHGNSSFMLFYHCFSYRKSV